MFRVAAASRTLVHFALVFFSVLGLPTFFVLLGFVVYFHGRQVPCPLRLFLVILLHFLVCIFLVLLLILALPRLVHRPSAPRRLPSAPAWTISTARVP